MSAYDHAAVLYDGGCRQVDGGSYHGTASYSTPGSASGQVCTCRMGCLPHDLPSPLPDKATRSSQVVAQCFGIVDDAEVRNTVTMQSTAAS